MQGWKLIIFVNAYKTRLKNRETLEEIDASYPKLTEEEIAEIHQSLEEQGII